MDNLQNLINCDYNYKTSLEVVQSSDDIGSVIIEKCRYLIKNDFDVVFYNVRDRFIICRTNDDFYFIMGVIRWEHENWKKRAKSLNVTKFSKFNIYNRCYEIIETEDHNRAVLETESYINVIGSF